jgi:hypothetical protein
MKDLEGYGEKERGESRAWVVLRRACARAILSAALRIANMK